MAAAADKVISKATILPEVERLSTINTKLNSLWSQTKGAIGSVLMKADQGIVATFGTVGESGMEALNNSQEFRKNMIDEFTKTHGYAPSGKDLETINSNAESVGNWSFGLNTALLTATNYIQLPKIYSSSFKAEKNILKGVAYEAEKYVVSLPKEGFGKLLYKSKNLASLFFNESFFISFFLSLSKPPKPRNTLPAINLAKVLFVDFNLTIVSTSIRAALPISLNEIIFGIQMTSAS